MTQEPTVFTTYSAAVEACFQQALDIARRQQAKYLELGAAVHDIPMRRQVP